MSAEAADEPQIRFQILRPFSVGGHGFDAGVISVHSISSYTPTTAILEVWVNGECLGLMTAHRSSPEGPTARTEALFHRGDDGRLEMLGFQVTGKPNGTTYRFL
jgi:hypothetical protein